MATTTPRNLLQSAEGLTLSLTGMCDYAPVLRLVTVLNLGYGSHSTIAFHEQAPDPEDVPTCRGPYKVFLR
jgi:hypothetical protein